MTSTRVRRHGHGFDKEYWEQHWQQGRRRRPGLDGREPAEPVPGPGDRRPGAGHGAGRRLRRRRRGDLAGLPRLARHRGRHLVRGTRSRRRARGGERRRGHVEWVEADLSVWEPGTRFDLVTTHYAHPAMPQLEFYDRIAEWVAPGGTLLIVGHLHTHGATDGQPREPRPRRPPARRGPGHRCRPSRRGWASPRGRSSPPTSGTARSPAARAEDATAPRRRRAGPTPR